MLPLFRTVLVAGRKGVLALRPYLRKDDTVSSSAASAHAHYLRVVRLVHHAERLPRRELFMYAATASLLAMFLEQKTQFMEVGFFLFESIHIFLSRIWSGNRLQ